MPDTAVIKTTPEALVVEDDPVMRELVTISLEADGLTVNAADSGAVALAAVDVSVPDVIVSDVRMPEMDGFTLVAALRSHERTRHVPVLFLTALDDPESVVHGLDLGADDYVAKPFRVADLQARVRSKLARPGRSLDALVRHPRGGLLTPERTLAAVEDARRTATPGCLAVVDIAERRALTARVGQRAAHGLVEELAALAADGQRPHELVGADAEGRLVLLFEDEDLDDARDALRRLAQDVTATGLRAGGELVHVTPLCGIAPLDPDVAAPALVRRARRAAASTASVLDLEPAVWDADLDARLARTAEPECPRPALLRRLQTPLQIAATFVIGVVLPFGLYVAADAAGFDISRVAYLVVVAALLVTAALILIEGVLALRPTTPPPAERAGPPPAASAVIAAYLPNEAPTILETVEAFLGLDYAGPLQIILAYNTPERLPVEDTLARIAEHDTRLTLLKVEGSTSKAQNVNAALDVVSGEIVGIFDADHHPMPEAFTRAWRWLGAGWDVVQGHCVVRNGDASAVARTVAVEFEAIYAVSHPGRARLHDFGIFGGSNGFWRSDVLRRTRMHGFMLTEDIDSSMRAILDGARIASDPGLRSRELAPTTLHALWGQRMRWAQGWYQVALRHTLAGLRSPALSMRQRVGFVILLAWREVYPWLSLQAIPLIAFMILQAGGPGHLDWMIPVFVLTTVFTLSVGPLQTFFAWRLAAPEIRDRRRWFVLYLLVATFAYTEWKNLIARVAQLRDLFGDQEWRVTPRDAD